MKLPLTMDLIKHLIAKGCDNPAITALKNEWSDLEVNSNFLSEKEIENIQAWAEKHDDGWATKKLLRKLKVLKTVKRSGGKPLRKLEALAEVIKEIIAKLPNKRLYEEGRDGNMYPYYVSNVAFVPAIRDERPACIEISMNAYSRGEAENQTLRVERDDIGIHGTTGMALLTDTLNLQLETEELNKVHEQEVETYKKYSPMTGKQFIAFGRAETEGSRWDVEQINLGSRRNGSKVVMDDEWKEDDRGQKRRNRKGSSPISSLNFWAENADDEDEEKAIALPIHPMLRVFDLRTHSFTVIHVNQVSPYKYDTALANKLVLPKVKKKMIDTLVNITDEEGSDIIKGKSGGVIVLSSGAPGTGKTLTAEVFAEASEKALYVVQCSQLGTDPDELEKELSKVLTRASRWKVVLLIDEADVYIHTRGDDIRQNAIVGVFLRLLEYYSGILFLTTNRETIIDDAIISRVTAHVRYSMPEKEEQINLWKILSKQYKLDLADNLISELCKEFPVISGRTIKQLIRLVKVLCKTRNTTPDANLFKEAALFQDIEKRKRESS